MAAKKMKTEKSRIDILRDTVDDVDPNVHLVQIPGARRFLISLIGNDFERALLWRLGWWDFMFVISSPPPKKAKQANMPSTIPEKLPLGRHQDIVIVLPNLSSAKPCSHAA